MEYRNANGPFSGYAPAYPFNHAQPQGFNVSPFGTPVIPGFPHHQDQYLASHDPRMTHHAAQQGPFMYSPLYSMHNMASALAGLNAHGRSVQPPLLGAADRLPVPFKKTDNFSSGSRWLPRSSLQQIPQVDPQVQSKNTSQPAEFSMTKKVALASEMPIGSLVSRMTAPQWGVIKISNIPYSVTRHEIVQFVGRHSSLITPQQGCAIHIIMDRITAKTMDCYAEFQTPADAQAAVARINRNHATGRAPRLGNRSVVVELSSQDALLKDLFPSAKCITWENGMPIAVANTDPSSTASLRFFTDEEIFAALQHAEFGRSPFCRKCMQRTYESTISTLYKFPWYATKLYTVYDRNELFKLVNCHIRILVHQLKTSKNVGLDERLLQELLHAGLNCPAFNERMKYTLCIYSEITTEIMKFPDMGKFFPFDTLVKFPKTEENKFLYYVKLISKGRYEDHAGPKLPNNFPMDMDIAHRLNSPYGHIYFEWPKKKEIAVNLVWQDAVEQEMKHLTDLVLSGFVKNEQENNLKSGLMPESSSASTRESQGNTAVSSGSDKSQSHVRASSRIDIFATPLRRASEQVRNSSKSFADSSDDGWRRGLFMHSTSGFRGRFPGHRNTLSSPTCLPSAGRT